MRIGFLFGAALRLRENAPVSLTVDSTLHRAGDVYSGVIAVRFYGGNAACDEPREAVSYRRLGETAGLIQIL